MLKANDEDTWITGQIPLKFYQKFISFKCYAFLNLSVP